ncbi:lipoprotein [Dissulfurispira thermophila]|uniref:Lipoprotein n=1 Tax=Dissulfurispira thermophila TaxID=2715679 RepID=A0A7G1H081_9BACT|nr:DUF2155 domain-containing protein [Dissulfurispira thermophila]BCB96180.1 lipoprotein [Dissulfurispira thermophila]
MKIMKVIAVGFVLLIMVVGCKKKEEQPVPKTPIGQAPMSAPMQPSMSPHGTTGSKVEKKILVPDSVKAKWGKVKFTIEDKTTKKSSEYTVNIGSEFKVPNTNLKIVVGEFLPDFRMDETTITSASDMPNNPAVRVEVFEAGKTIFKGWLYSKFPTIHPFEHERYGITLKEGVKG